MTTLVESSLNPIDAVVDHVLGAGEPWMHTVKRGQVLRIVDLEGNQAADTIFYNAHDSAESYSVTDTVQQQRSVYLSTGSVLVSNRGRAMLSIVADTCGRHDTLGGACSAESNIVRYAPEKKYMHSCRDSFLLALARADKGMDKRDLAPNINFFMNVPVTPEGGLRFADGLSGPGKYVELRAEMDVIVLVSNCPQLNNPCNAYNPTPVRFLVWNQEA
jgi:urea carboxylase-associated protein 1